MYDTYGFPVDLTADILRTKNIQVDNAAFEEEMKKARLLLELIGKVLEIKLLRKNGSKLEKNLNQQNFWDMSLKKQKELC